MMTKVVLSAALALALTSPALAGGKKYGRADNPCVGGEVYYPQLRRCGDAGKITPESKLVERAKCTPGERRWVPVPGEPGEYRIQTCGYLRREK